MPDTRDLRRALVQRLQRDGHLRSASIAEAMESVPRELFVPGVPLEDAYRSSEAIVTKRIDGVGVSSASAPDVVALMLEQLDPQPGQRVLEIGAGTGYNAALLAHIVGHTGRVVSVDIDEDLVEAAREHLANAGYEWVDVRRADGALGVPDENAAFDRIILTVASRDIAPAWRDQLARPHGRLVLPLSIRGPQRSMAFEPDGPALTARGVRACSFIPLRGLLAAPTLRLALGSHAAISLGLADDSLPVSPDRLTAQFLGARLVQRTGVDSNVIEVRDGLHLWLVAHEPAICSIWAEASIAALPDLFGIPDQVRAGLGCVACDGLALLGWSDAGAHAGELCVFAPEAAAASAARLLDLVRAWARSNRPRDAHLTIAAYPREYPFEPAPAAAVVEERWTRFALTWSN